MSLEYDESRKPGGLHYNAVQVVNRNLHDAAGRLIHERLEHNYRYDADGHQVVTTTPVLMWNFDVAITYDDRGHVQEKSSGFARTETKPFWSSLR